MRGGNNVWDYRFLFPRGRKLYIPYAEDYSECINQAKADQLRKARPKLVRCPKDFERYEILYLGFPNYWGTMPMPVFTFLEQCHFSGKVIRVFCTHEGDGFGRSIEDIRQIYPDAVIEAGLAIRGSRISQAQTEMKNWILSGNSDKGNRRKL